MNIKRAIRIAKEQPWFKQFNEYVNKTHGGIEKFANLDWKRYNSSAFVSMAFVWGETKEGYDYWLKIRMEFSEKYYDKSVAIFTSEITKKPVAKLVGTQDLDLFIKSLKDHNIKYDLIEKDKNGELTAYVYDTKVVAEEI